VAGVRDPKARQEAIAVARRRGLKVAFGAQPILLMGKHNLGTADPAARRRAVDVIRAAVDEATEWDAVGVAVLSGPDPGKECRAAKRSYLIASLKELCEHSRARNGPPVLLETFDRVPFGKNCLVGPTVEAADLARHVMVYYPAFGLMLDLSHLPLLEETADLALRAAAPFLRHVHIGNCVKRHPGHPAYGDNHPMFGIPEGEVGKAELTAFLRVLLDLGYVAPGKKNIVSFEVKPFGNQSSRDVIENAKTTLDAAWAAA
jgi:sugar phosphate isomerase/epimerase